MDQFKIIFVGIIMFIAVNGGRDVAVLDLSKGDNMHGHDIAPHEAWLEVAASSVMPGSDWEQEPDCKESFRCFSLNGYELAIAGLADDPPLEVTDKHRCLVPHLTLECPNFELNDKMVMRMADATLHLRSGELTAEREPEGAIRSVYSHAAASNVTITAMARGGKVRKLVLDKRAEVWIKNIPVSTMKDRAPNHFLANYRYDLKGNCCTNNPFPIRPEGCDAKMYRPPQPAQANVQSSRYLSTLACSNSGYP